MPSVPLYPPFGPIRLVLYVTAFLLVGLVVNILLCLSLLVYPFADSTAYDFNSWIAYLLWEHTQRYFEHSRHGEITFSGDHIPHGKSALVIANHQTFADFYLVHSLALRAGMLGRVRYFAKSSLKWMIPIFGWSMWAVGMIMVDRNWTKDAPSIHKAFARFTKMKRPVWVVSYLEGTRRKPATLQASQKWCEQKGKPILENVLWPKTKGFVASVKALRGSDVKFLYDLTIVFRGPDGSFEPPHPATILSCPNLAEAGWKFHVHAQVIDLESLPQEDAKLSVWAEQSFVRKDKLIASMKKDWASAVGKTWQ